MFDSSYADCQRQHSSEPVRTSLRYSCGDLLFVSQIAEEKKNSDTDCDDDEWKEKKLRDEKRSRFLNFEQIFRNWDRHTSAFRFHKRT